MSYGDFDANASTGFSEQELPEGTLPVSGEAQETTALEATAEPQPLPVPDEVGVEAEPTDIVFPEPDAEPIQADSSLTY